MELIVTQEIHDAARAAGACSSLPAVGTPIDRVSFAHVVWAYCKMPHLLTPLEPPTNIGHVPLWGLTHSGSGYGYGYGYGSGYGSGYGFGYGSGYGDGYGSGYGNRYAHLFPPREITLP